MKQMNLKLRKITALLLALLLVLGLCPASVAAEGTEYVIGDGAGQYATLADAYAAISGTGTIVLEKDLSDVPVISMSGKNITLDLNGHELQFLGTGSGDSNLTAITLTGNTMFFTLEDNSASGDGNITNAKGRVFNLNSGATLTMNSGNIKNVNPGRAGSVQGAGVQINWNSTFNMNGGEISNCNSNWAGGVKVGGYFNMTGGSIINNIDSGNPYIGVAFFNAQGVQISGGTIGNRIENNIDATKVTITGGTFDYNTFKNGNQSVALADFLGDGCSISGDGPYTVIQGEPEPEYEAQIGETNYETLTEAITAAQSGETVVVLKTPAENSYAVNKAINLTVNETATVSLTGSMAGVTNHGELTLTSATVSGAVTNDGELTIESGTYQGNITNSDTMTVTSGNFTGTVTNAGTLDVTDGVFTSLSNSSQLTIADGEFTTLTNTGTATIAGGEFDTITNNAGSIAISSGSFDTVANNSGATMTVNGGTFEGALTNAGTLSITDGSFLASANTTSGEFTHAASIPAPKIAVLENGYWVLGYANDPVAKVGDTVYYTLAEAVEAVPMNGTIQMIGDSIDTSLVNFRSGKGNLTLDLNGHVIYGDGHSSVIFYDGGYGKTLTIIDSNPTATHADASLPAGGVITGGYADGTNHVPNNYNSSLGAVDNNGGGLYINNGIVNLQAGTVYDCHAANGGGGIFLNGSGALNMTGGCISHCSAAYVGGGILSYNGAQNPVALQMSGGTIEYCEVTAGENAAHGGGAIRLGDGCSFTMSGNAVIDNCVRYINVTGSGNALGCGGGAILSGGGGTITMNGGIISNCHVYASPDCGYPYSYGFGGGIFAVSSGDSQKAQTQLIMNGGTIIGCTADREAGGICVQNAAFVMNGGTITECTCSTKGGGGLSYFSARTSISLLGGQITNCSSLATDGRYLKTNEIAGGGAVCGYDVPMTLGEDFVISGNSAVFGNGGGILLGNPAAQLKVYGHPVVISNTANDATDNVFLNTGVTIKVIGELTDGCSIGVNTKELPTIVDEVVYDVLVTTELSDAPNDTSYETENGATDSGDLYFTSDKPAYAVRNQDPVKAGSQYGEVVLTLEVNYLKVIYHANNGTFTQYFETTYNDPATNRYTTNVGTGDAPAFNVVIAPYGESGAEVTREGFDFQSWNTAPDGSGVTYLANESTARTARIEGHGTIHLYAQWHRIVSYSITIGADLKMNFYVQGIPDDAADGYTMTFTKSGSTSFISKGIQGTKTDYGYKFTLDKIYPQNMTDQITANLYDGSSTRVASVTSKSIQTYCNDYYLAYADDESDKAAAVRKLCADTLEYGAMCQKYNGESDATKLANNLPWVAENKSASTEVNSLTSDTKILSPASEELTGELKVTGSGILLGNSLQVYFVVENTGGSHVYTVKDGKQQTASAYNQLQETGRAKANLNTAGTTYLISAPILATGGAGNKLFYIYQDGSPYQGVRDSVYSYLLRNRDSQTEVGTGLVTLGQMCSAVYNYCASAKYFYDHGYYFTTD